MIDTRRPDTVIRLREGQRSFTRDRICAAARETFAAQDFASATIDQIAAAAGTRRSTLYNHFRDKHEILAAIAADFLRGVAPLIARVPTPRPSPAEIDLWLRDIAAFTARERIPTVLLLNLGTSVEVPAAVELLGRQLVHALGERLPAFRHAVEPGPGQGLARIRAVVVLRQIGWSCFHFGRGDDAGHVTDMFTVATELFHHFVCHTGAIDPASADAASPDPEGKIR